METGESVRALRARRTGGRKRQERRRRGRRLLLTNDRCVRNRCRVMCGRRRDESRRNGTNEHTRAASQSPPRARRGRRREVLVPSSTRQRERPAAQCSHMRPICDAPIPIVAPRNRPIVASKFRQRTMRRGRATVRIRGINTQNDQSEPTAVCDRSSSLFRGAVSPHARHVRNHERPPLLVS